MNQTAFGSSPESEDSTADCRFAGAIAGRDSSIHRHSYLTDSYLAHPTRPASGPVPGPRATTARASELRLQWLRNDWRGSTSKSYGALRRTRARSWTGAARTSSTSQTRPGKVPLCRGQRGGPSLRPCRRQRAAPAGAPRAPRRAARGTFRASQDGVAGAAPRLVGWPGRRRRRVRASVARGSCPAGQSTQAENHSPRGLLY